MTNFTEFKRMNFFTGFFTTAEDWNDGQDYHLEKRKLHNRGLHTAGIIRGEGQELKVKAGGGFNLKIMPGAVLNGEGREIYLGKEEPLPINPSDYHLPVVVYIVIECFDEETDYVENVEAPQYSGYTRVKETPLLKVTTTEPANKTQVELARIDLQPGMTEITNDEIDRGHVVWAGSVAVVEEGLPPPMEERVVLLMLDTRRDFAALGGRFSVPSAGDVRHAALTVEILARIGRLRSAQLPDVLAVIATIEQDIGQEIGAAHPAVTTMSEFQTYQSAVSQLLAALQAGEAIDTLLTRQGAAAEAARELSEVVVQDPVANAGPDQRVTTSEDEATVTLDASASKAFGGREIERYRWSLVESHDKPPVADAGPDRTVAASDDEATVELDASASEVFGGREIVRYRWDKTEG